MIGDWPGKMVAHASDSSIRERSCEYDPGAMTNNLPTIAVTGVTGALGGLVARELSTAGLAQRLLARTVSNAPSLPNSVIFPFSYADPQACAVALDGVETLLMISATESDDRLDRHRSFIDSALAGGFAHIVHTSLVGAAPDAVFTLARALRHRGVHPVHRYPIHIPSRQLLPRFDGGPRR